MHNNCNLKWPFHSEFELQQYKLKLYHKLHRALEEMRQDTLRHFTPGSQIINKKKESKNSDNKMLKLRMMQLQESTEKQLRGINKIIQRKRYNYANQLADLKYLTRKGNRKRVYRHLMTFRWLS